MYLGSRVKHIRTLTLFSNATILTYSFHLVHIHTSSHTRMPVASTTNLTILKNLATKVNVCPSKASKRIKELKSIY